SRPSSTSGLRLGAAADRDEPVGPTVPRVGERQSVDGEETDRGPKRERPELDALGVPGDGEHRVHESPGKKPVQQSESGYALRGHAFVRLRAQKEKRPPIRIDVADEIENVFNLLHLVDVARPTRRVLCASNFRGNRRCCAASFWS